LFITHHNDCSSPLRARLFISVLHVLHHRIFQNVSSARHDTEAGTAQDLNECGPVYQNELLLSDELL